MAVVIRSGMHKEEPFKLIIIMAILHSCAFAANQIIGHAAVNILLLLIIIAVKKK
jgi:hypothetical protein